MADGTSVVVRDDSYRAPMRVVDVGGRPVEVHIRRSSRVRGHRIVVRYGFAPELVVRPRATDAEIDAAITTHLDWLPRPPAKGGRPPPPSTGSRSSSRRRSSRAFASSG